MAEEFSLTLQGFTIISTVLSCMRFYTKETIYRFMTEGTRDSATHLKGTDLLIPGCEFIPPHPPQGVQGNPINHSFVYAKLQETVLPLTAFAKAKSKPKASQSKTTIE